MTAALRILMVAMLMTLGARATGQSVGQPRPTAAPNGSINNDVDPAEQQRQSQPVRITSERSPAGTADSAVGRAGERQTRQQNTTVAPMARLISRISNRVDARVRNRIDRNYDPQANAASPFQRADEQNRRVR